MPRTPSRSARNPAGESAMRDPTARRLEGYEAGGSGAGAGAGDSGCLNAPFFVVMKMAGQAHVPYMDAAAEPLSTSMLSMSLGFRSVAAGNVVPTRTPLMINSGGG